MQPGSPFSAQQGEKESTVMSGFVAGASASLRQRRRADAATVADRRFAWAVPAEWIRALSRVTEVMATRRQLAAMDQRMLADIGTSRAEALEEANRAFWDTAPHPRQQL
jgi:uncharacterized protein YjiS (DUF1127 family)